MFEGGELLELENGRHLRPFFEYGRNPWGGRTRYAAVDWEGRGVLDRMLRAAAAKCVGAKSIHEERT